MVRLTIWDDKGWEQSIALDHVDNARKSLADFRSQQFTYYRLEWVNSPNLQELGNATSVAHQQESNEVLVEDGEL